jgi:hypothetical protein
MLHASLAPTAFADTRLRQIRRLVAVQQEHPTEFSGQGHDLTRRAIFAMVLDCRAASVSPARLADALRGEPVASHPFA